MHIRGSATLIRLRISLHVHVHVPVQYMYKSTCMWGAVYQWCLCLSINPSVETDISCERGSDVETISVGTWQAPQSSALPPQGVCVQNVTTQVYIYMYSKCTFT